MNNREPFSNDDKIRVMNEDRQKIKGKMGRPRKNNDKKITAGEKEVKVDEYEENPPKITISFILKIRYNLEIIILLI